MPRQNRHPLTRLFNASEIRQGETSWESSGDRPWLDVPAPEGFYIQLKTWQFCLRNVWRRRPTLILGPTGAGKTALVAAIAATVGRQLYPVNMGATTDPRAVLIGTTHFTEGETRFCEARFITGIQDPRGLVLLDEITRGDDDANNILFPLLDGQRYVSLDEAHPPKVVVTHANVAFFATANVGQEYTGTRTLDRALLDRFCLVELDYPPKKAEIALLMTRTDISKKAAQSLVDFADRCRDLWRRHELSTPVSTRMLLEAAAVVDDGFSLLDALEYCVFPFFDASEGVDAERTRVRQVLLQS